MVRLYLTHLFGFIDKMTAQPKWTHLKVPSLIKNAVMLVLRSLCRLFLILYRADAAIDILSAVNLFGYSQNAEGSDLMYKLA